MQQLEGKCGLVVGIANAGSIAYGCAKALRAAGAELALTDLNGEAEPLVRPLAVVFAVIARHQRGAHGAH
jgi:enoyl-[acyl-carrier protein] reductase I